MRQRAIDALKGEESPELAEVRRGWCLGNAGFRERMLRLLEAASEKLREGREVDAVVRRSHGEEEAKRILLLGQRLLALTAEELGATKPGDARKLALAAVVRSRTSVTNRWIAEALHLGHVSRVSRTTKPLARTRPTADR